MRTLLTICASQIICINLYCQPFGDATPGYRTVRIDYENTDGEKGITSFRYDKKGRLLRTYWHLCDSSKYSENLYETDQRGLIVSAWRKISDGLTSFELFTYDSAGNKTSEFFRRSDNITGFSDYMYTDNRLASANMRNYKGWINGTMYYKYGIHNKIISATLENGGKVLSNICYEYDQNGNMIRETWDFHGKWKQIFSYKYEKTGMIRNFYSSPLLSNSGSYRISSEDYTYNNEKGGPSFYNYSENGLLTSKVFVRSDGFSSITDNEYDMDQKLISSRRMNSDSTITVFKYIYDENKNLIIRSFYNSDTLSGFESYLFDQEGTLLRSYINNLDNWLTGSIEYMSDLTGKISSGFFKGQNGNDALITFHYNDEDLIHEIIWNFATGKFQKYSYSYALQE